MGPVQNWAQPTEKAQLTQERKLNRQAWLAGIELKMQEICQKMTGSFFYENLEIDLQAWAFATSLRDCSKPKRSENQTKKWAQALAGAQCQHSK